MAIQVAEVTPNAVLSLGTAVTVHSGTAQLGGSQGAVVVVRSGGAPEEFGFYVPDATPLAEGEAEPVAVAEVSLMALTSLGTSTLHVQGVDRVTAAFVPDPRGGTARWLYLSGAAHAAAAMRIGYRVTLVKG
ncbi:hypothetical protein [Catelliglobosispora koreensis]|uniref:hypothetical protein n=1 Tax=Catelliglobosispora koreensis TaxID=129052 RepID=UPI00037F7D6B|nr:hypothetical protein [Catelliglobosispora koreensis]